MDFSLSMEQEILIRTSRLVSNTRRTASFFLSERKAALDFIAHNNSFKELQDSVFLSKLLEDLQKTFRGFADLGVIDAQGSHPVPDDPVEAFTFVGTRYAYRTTKQIIDRLRQTGYDDLGILDLAIAVADANIWARIYRLAGLKPELFYLHIA